MEESVPGILFDRNLVAQMVRAQDSYPLVSGRQFDPAPRYEATRKSGFFVLPCKQGACYILGRSYAMLNFDQCGAGT
jgi:hypothetical protein